MLSNKNLVETFFQSMGRGDFRTLNACYSHDIIYSDPIFGLLKGDDVRMMWQMLLEGAKDISVKILEIEDVDEEYITCRYSISYFFEPTGRTISNLPKAFMRIKDEKIIEHSDGYRLSTFIANAYGLKGQVLGWSGFMKKSVQRRYSNLLTQFINMF